MRRAVVELPRLLGRHCCRDHGGASSALLAVHVSHADTTSSSLSQHHQPPGRHFSSSASLHAANDTNSIGLLDALGMVLSPSQLGASVLELTHSSTGLPWWASIPATAVAARVMLLPLSLKAKQASANIQLLNQAFTQAKLLTLDMSASDSKSLGRFALVRTMYRHLQARHHLPSMRWYWANALAQTAVFGTLTSALGAMSSAVWPGFTTGGPPGLRDLTSPPVYLATMSTPFGTMGAVMPLAIILTYVRALDSSRTASVPGIGVALRVLAIPYYCLALLQPHATLLYWLTHTLTCALVQAWPRPTPAHPHPVAESTLISVTTPASITPDTLPGAESQPTQQQRSPEEINVAGEVENPGQRLDVDLLLALGEHFHKVPASQRSTTAAVLCYGRAVRELEAGQPAAADATQGAEMSTDKLEAAAEQEDMGGSVACGTKRDSTSKAALLSRAREGLSAARERAQTWQQQAGGTQGG